ncbi:hypothetical protein MMC14_000108 [Varicellaria rhodocarpa]|nr:hypothetical protein [Varicellaria rhodocarpa]
MAAKSEKLQRYTSVDYEISGNFPLDDAVFEILPSGTRVISANSYGSSAWSITARVNVENSEGSTTNYFLKCVMEESGSAQLKGEYYAMVELWKTVPSLVPKAIGYGKFKVESPTTYFLLIEFVNISDRLPDPAKLGAQIAELHRTSISPTGKFGFNVPTYDGRLPQTVDWDSSWTSFFGNLLRGILELDIKVNGKWNDLEEMVEKTVNIVLPRLIGILESNGRTLKPCLIHGDLWEGNIGTDFESENIYIFDACSYYAHNEMEIGMWRTDHHRLKAKAYRREYLRNFEPTEPVEEWDDRNRLYSIKTKLMYSAHVPGTKVRNQAYDDLCYLFERYGNQLE